MKKHITWVRIVALATFASGLANLNSVIHPRAPQLHPWLRETFPIEFLHLSRFLTLLVGFALVVSSINIYRRKKRAFQLVLLLAGLSVFFHLGKGHNLEQALVSLTLIVVLLLSRKNFTVKSSVPDMGWGLLGLSLALVVVFGYGVVGFWFLDPREFGINFTIGDSVHRTLSFLSMRGDPEIVPHTRHARWFIRSLYLMSVSGVAFSFMTMFRPMVYRLRTLPHERAMAGRLLARYGRSSIDYFKLWHDKSYFFSASGNCFFAYKVGASFAVALGDPVGPENEIEASVREFTEFCNDNGWGVCFHQAMPDFLSAYQKLGFRRLKIGDEAIVDLDKFSLEGKSMREFRTVKNKLEKEGIRIVRYDAPVSEEVFQQVKRISDEWLEIPGRRERGFTLGSFSAPYVKSTPLVLALDAQGNALAFVNLIPSYHKGEITIDLMRRRPDSPNGIMDYLFIRVFEMCRERGFHRFSLGMAPMSGFQERDDATREERAVYYFFQRLNFLFSYRGLFHHKAKFGVAWEPRYLIHRNVLELPRLAIALTRISEF